MSANQSEDEDKDFIIEKLREQVRNLEATVKQRDATIRDLQVKVNK